MKPYLPQLRYLLIKRKHSGRHGFFKILSLRLKGIEEK